MKKWLHYLYKNLPFVREARYQASLLEKISSQLSQAANRSRSIRVIETAVMVQALESIKASDPRYRDPKRLLVHGAQYWSQFYEDGMITEVFRRIGTPLKTFLEMGVENGAETNTTALLSKGWKGWWIEGSAEHCSAVKARLEQMPTLSERLTIKQAFITPESIGELLLSMGVPEEIDLFSLDIDLDTYHVWAALPTFRPRVIVVEYNPGIPPDQSWINPYIPNRVWDGVTQSYGASLKAFENLGRERGYSLVGCDLSGNNAFFVRNDLLGEHFLEPFTSENHYEPPRFGLWYRWAHKSMLFGESDQKSGHQGL